MAAAACTAQNTKSTNSLPWRNALSPDAGEQGQNVRLISVPSFHRSATIVLVNLRTLDCTPISLQGCSMEE